MKLIPDDISIDFMAFRGKAFVLSGIACLVSLLFVFIAGLNLGIDFKGGSSVIVAFDTEAQVQRDQIQTEIAELIRQTLRQDQVAEGGEATLAKDAQVQVQDFHSGGGSSDRARYLIYTEVTSLISKAKQDQIKARIAKDFGDKTRLFKPGEGADIFYLTFPKQTDILGRYGQLKTTFKELGFDETVIRSDFERQLKLGCYEWFRLLREETEKGDASAATEAQDQYETCVANVRKDLVGKKDTRFTVVVEEFKAKVRDHLAAKFPNSGVDVESSTSVSESVGKDMFYDGLLAILYAIIGILIYISLRFDFRYAPGAVVALIHDVTITLGIFAIFQVKFSLPIIAALLTTVGYSLNDTIVVLDRVRETFDAYRGRDMKELLNRAINNTLSRTVLTSLTTAIVVTSILVLGGGLIQDFALALIIGIVCGTYSSIYIASPLVYYMDNYLKQRESKDSGRSAKPAPA